MRGRRPGDRAVAPLIAVVLVLVFLAGLLLFAVAAAFLGWAAGGFDHMGPMGFMPLAGAGSFVLWLVILVVVVTLVYRRVEGEEREPDAALEELRVAYARGDLDDEEFERRRERLREERGS